MSAVLTERTEKQIASDALARMPETATLEDISEDLAILAAIRVGQRAAAEGRTVSQEEAERRSKAWIGE